MEVEADESLRCIKQRLVVVVVVVVGCERRVLVGKK